MLKEVMLLAELLTRAKGATAAGSPTSIAVSADVQALHVVLAAAAGLDATALGRLDSIIAGLASIDGHVDTVETLLASVSGKDFATQTTLASVLAKLTAGMVTQLGARTVAQSPAVNIASDDPIAKKIGTRAYAWGGVISRTVTSVSAKTAAVGAAGEYEIATDTDCYVLVGADPTATATTSRFLPAGSAFTLQLGATDKVAVIRRSADGNLTVLPVA